MCFLLWWWALWFSGGSVVVVCHPFHKISSCEWRTYPTGLGASATSRACSTGSLSVIFWTPIYFTNWLETIEDRLNTVPRVLDQYGTATYQPAFRQLHGVLHHGGGGRATLPSVKPCSLRSRRPLTSRVSSHSPRRTRRTMVQLSFCLF